MTKIKWYSPKMEAQDFIMWQGVTTHAGTTINFRIRVRPEAISDVRGKLVLSTRNCEFKIFVVEGGFLKIIAVATDLKSSKKAAEKFLSSKKELSHVLSEKGLWSYSNSLIHWDRRKRIVRNGDNSTVAVLTASVKNLKFLVIPTRTTEKAEKYTLFMGKYSDGRAPYGCYTIVVRDSRLVKHYSSGELDYEQEEFTMVEERGRGRSAKEKKNMCEIKSVDSIHWAEEHIKRFVYNLVRTGKINKTTSKSICLEEPLATKRAIRKMSSSPSSKHLYYSDDPADYAEPEGRFKELLDQ